jgi:LysR family hydrogen peroxide-inducible transcriptional activator
LNCFGTGIQPALSMQIRDLERTLGIAVVERRPGDVILTDVGRCCG